MTNKLNEEELASHIIHWLEHTGWDVFQEVTTGRGVADIVAVKDSIVWIIETKVSLTFALVDQARDRLCWAHKVSVAVPMAKRNSRGDTAYYVLKHFGIGLLQVNRYLDYHGNRQVREVFAANTRADSPKCEKLLKSLRPEHKTFAKAGSAHAKRWTPFKQTCKHILDFLEKKGSSTVRNLVNGIEHHYSSDFTARTNIVNVIDAGFVPHVFIDRKQRPILVRANKR